MEPKDNESSTLPSTSKMICLTCKDTVTNFYDFYRMVQMNQSLFVEYIKKVQQANPESEQPQRLIFTLRTVTDGGAVLNEYGTLEYSIDESKSNASDSVDKQSAHNSNVLATADDIRTTETYDETTSAKVELDTNDDSDSGNMVLFSRKNIDEKLPDHLKVRTSKEKSDAQIKEFVNLSCDICKSNSQFNSFKELQEHFRYAPISNL